jgi:hypothetical protein
VFYNRYKIKSNRGLGVKVKVAVQVKEEEKKEEAAAQTTALGGVKGLNKAQIIQRRL